MSKIEVDAIEPQSGTTLTLGASGDSVNIASGATITDFTSTGIDDNADATAITIDSSERVGIGTASPDCKLKVDAGTTASIFAPAMIITSSTGGAGGATPIDLRHSTNSSSGFRIQIAGSAGSNNATLNLIENSAMIFATNNDERMRIASDSTILIGKTSKSVSTPGVQLATNGAGFTTNSVIPMFVNRQLDNGGLITFYQASIEEGSISVSGSTVSYNGFTGTHWSRFTDNSTPTILRGTVLESLDEMCDWYNLHFETTTTTQDENGNDVTNTEKKVIPYVLQEGQSVGDTVTYNHEGTDVQATIVKETDIKHVKSKVSDTIDAKNVYGVFMAYDEDGEGYNDFYVASVGSFVVRIKQGETVAKGDLLQSNGDGTAKVQTDDNVKSSSFAKVLSTTVIETYEDGSFLVPCSLMC
jgi:hypothetical protein